MGSGRNNEMNLAWQLIAQTNMSVFLTGKAGTGKTTFLKRLRDLSPKRMVVLAPTGVAAINAEGQTIHSFFQLPFGPIVPGVEREQKRNFRMSKEKKRLIQTLDLLVIDEISMVRCDLLDAVDAELRKYRNRLQPFGGVQLLLIGDLQQLAPVAKESEWQLLAPYYQTQYFFGSKALQQTSYVTVELLHIYRQQDAEFVSLLGKVRDNRVDNETIKTLNAHFVPDFAPPEDEDWIRLTTHNRMADEYNARKLDALPSRAWKFHAEVEGNFPESSFPADKELVLKVGAQVMFIKNDPSGEHAFYNGKIGVVRDFDKDGIAVFSKEDGLYTVVPQVEWENTKFVIDPETKEIKEEVEGTFKQYPLRQAWAITVHKSQGLTFDHAVLDIQDSFAHGQTYVALSRCRTLDGLVLSRPIDARSVITDASVNSFIDRELEESRSLEERLPQMKRDYFLSLLREAFSFSTLMSDLSYVHRVASEHLYKAHADYVQLLADALSRTEKELLLVADKFAVQYGQLVAQSQNPEKDGTLQSRIHAASDYFGKKTLEILFPVIDHEVLKINNKTVAKQFGNALDAFRLSYRIKTGILTRFMAEDFSIQTYLRTKAHAALGDDVEEDGKKAKAQKSKRAKQPIDKTEHPEDPELFEALRQLRQQIATEAGLAPFMVLSDRTLHELAAAKPTTPEDFSSIHGIGSYKTELYASKFIEVIENHGDEG